MPGLHNRYEGPFHVIKKDSKFFTIDFGGKTDTISIDCLKPAHLDTDQPVKLPNLGVEDAHRRICVQHSMMVLRGSSVAAHYIMITNHHNQTPQTLKN